MSRGCRAWAAVAALLVVFALVGVWIGASVDTAAIDWQPSLAAREPWRAWSAVGVHYSERHLTANLAGAAVVAAFGIAADMPVRAAGAWLVAWPLTQFGLWTVPALTHFGGLSGVLHAGVLIVVVGLLARGTRLQRAVGMLVLLGCVAKLVLEQPFGAPLHHPADWDIATAPIAHVTGSLAGLVCGILTIGRYRFPGLRPRLHA